MLKCLKCGHESDFAFRALTIRTLPVRDLSGEKKVQAIGDFQDFGVCASCAAQTLSVKKDIRRNVGKKFGGFALVAVAGILLEAAAFLFLNAERVYVLLGLAAIACGLIGMYSSAKDGMEEKNRISSMSNEDALRYAAWACVLENAPKKDLDADLSYIPVDRETRKRKNGDLMILYDLLPQIAVKAHKMICEDYDGSSGGGSAPAAVENAAGDAGAAEHSTK